MQCKHNGRLQRCRKRVDSGGGQFVILLTPPRFARVRHFVALELGRGRWDLRSLVCKEIGNDMLQELTANIYQGFNLQQEQEASGVGQCVCSRTAAAELRNRTQTHSKAAPSPVISPGSRDVLSQGKEGVHFSAKTY